MCLYLYLQNYSRYNKIFRIKIEYLFLPSKAILLKLSRFLCKCNTKPTQLPIIIIKLMKPPRFRIDPDNILEIAFPAERYNADISNTHVHTHPSPIFFSHPPLRFSPAASREIDIIFNVVARARMSSAKERVGRGWSGCFAVRNTLHYTVGVVYKRLFFFSLAPPPPLAALFSFVFTFLPSSIFFFSGGHVDVPASL